MMIVSTAISWISPLTTTHDPQAVYHKSDGEAQQALLAEVLEGLFSGFPDLYWKESQFVGILIGEFGTHVCSTF